MSSIPYPLSPTQASPSPQGGTGHEPGALPCPRCGVALVPFDVRASGLLDTCLLMQSLLLDVRREIEAMMFGEEAAALQDEGERA